MNIDIQCLKYGCTEGHSLIDYSHVRTLMIDQSTVDGWIFQAFTIEQHAYSDDQWLDIQTTNHSPASNMRTGMIECACCPMVNAGWNIQPSTIN